MYCTTINKILNSDPCDPGKVKELVGDIDYDAQISFKQIYDNVGLQDAVWCIQTLDYNDEIQAFALRCARRVEHLDEKGAAKKCNDALERYLKGEATKEELYNPASAAAWAVWSAVMAVIAARTASVAIAASAWAAWAAVTAANGDILKQIEQDFLTTFCGE